MRELSLHILDLVENSIAAGAARVEVTVAESCAEDRLSLSVCDDGCGMPPEKARRPDDPFLTTRTTRRVGLGLSLLAAAARRCEGDITVERRPGGGTIVKASFRHRHIDRAPLGDMAGTLATIILSHPHIDFVYTHTVDGKEFALDTRELASELEGMALNDPVVMHHLTAAIRRSLKNLSDLR
jgi:anti-sigma regulatory factor (Ser/Thr protein kinase)